MVTNAAWHFLHPHIPRIAMRLWPASGTRDHWRGGTSMRQIRTGRRGVGSTCSPPLEEAVLPFLAGFVNELATLREADERTNPTNDPELIGGVGNDGQSECVREPVQGPATVELMHRYDSPSRCEAGVG